MSQSEINEILQHLSNKTLLSKEGKKQTAGQKVFVEIILWNFRVPG